MTKNDKLPTIDIKGKEYVLVKDRILRFNELYPKGSITTKLLSAPDSEKVVVTAVVSPEENRLFTAHSQALVGDGYINKTSALENAETSAVGRALAMMGIGIIDSVASVDEVRKAEGTESSEQVGERLDNPDGCSTCHAPAGKPHASGCKAIAN